MEPPPTGRTCLLSIDRGEYLLCDTRRRLTECLVEVDRLRKLLENERIAPRKLNVACKRSLDAIGFAATQRACRIPGQQKLDSQPLRVFFDPDRSASRHDPTGCGNF